MQRYAASTSAKTILPWQPHYSVTTNPALPHLCFCSVILHKQQSVDEWQQESHELKSSGTMTWTVKHWKKGVKTIFTQKLQVNLTRKLHTQLNSFLFSSQFLILISQFWVGIARYKVAVLFRGRNKPSVHLTSNTHIFVFWVRPWANISARWCGNGAFICAKWLLYWWWSSRRVNKAGVSVSDGDRAEIRGLSLSHTNILN